MKPLVPTTDLSRGTFLSAFICAAAALSSCKDFAGAGKVDGGMASGGGSGTGSGGVAGVDSGAGADPDGGGAPGTGGTAPPAGTGGAATGSGGAATGMGGATTGMGTGGAPMGAGGAASAPAALAGSTTHDFGSVEVGVASTAFTWTISNTGGVAAGIKGLASTNTAEVMATNNCTATLAAGASCTVVVTIKPSAGGARAATLTILGLTGGNVTLAVSANAQLRVTVTVTGAGSVTSKPAGITCGTTCSMLVNHGAEVTLQARTTNGNGSNVFFSGWGGGCSSPERDCFLAVNASVSAAASFSTMTNNLIFVASTIVPVNKGSATAYDAVCNTVATAAGINTTAGNGYMAFISDAASLASARIPTSARGWVRMDGKPFGDTLASLLTDHKVFNSIMFHEDGSRASGSVLTGMTQDGSLGLNTCSNWTSTSMSDFGNAGSIDGGPGSWAFWNRNILCSDTSSTKVICMGTTKSAAVAPAVTSGKRIWVTSTPFLPGGIETPDAKCQVDRPAGVTTAVALISTSTKAASSVLMPTASYVRMDGTLVGTGAELAASPRTIASGIWQSADGVYRAKEMNTAYPLAWTGSQTIGSGGTEASTCGDWTSGSSARMGILADWSVNSYAWWQLGSSPCDFGHSLYCVQTAP